MALKRTGQQIQDFQLRLGTLNNPNNFSGVLSQGYLRIDAYFSAGPGYGRYFGLHFPVCIKTDQHLEINIAKGFFRGDETMLASNSRSGKAALVAYDLDKDKDPGLYDVDWLFPSSDFENSIENALYSPGKGEIRPVFLLGMNRMRSLWKSQVVGELIHAIQDDVGTLGYKIQPVRYDNREIFEEALASFPADFQRKALESKCFNFDMERIDRRKKVVTGKVPYIRLVSVPMNGQPKT